MRQAIGNRWPALSHWFGLHPWDVERLTPFEIKSYLEALHDINKSREG